MFNATEESNETNFINTAFECFSFFLSSCHFYRFNPAFNMATIRQAINEAVERGNDLSQYCFIAVNFLYFICCLSFRLIGMRHTRLNDFTSALASFI